jgi:hypothetical protein
MFPEPPYVAGGLDPRGGRYDVSVPVKPVKVDLLPQPPFVNGGLDPR